MEFLELKQGDRSVTVYEAKFTELARIAPDYVSSEARRAKRFQQGLKPEIRSGVIALQLKTYTSVVQAALVIKSDQRLAAKERGASKSFISLNCVNKMQLMLEDLDEPLTIKVTNRDKIHVSQLCPKCSIEISGHSFPPDLIPFELGELDIILGMDWLSLYMVSIDCKKKRIVLYTTDNIRISYQGQKKNKKFLSVLQEKNLLRQGCEAYLAHVVDTKKETPTLDEILIVREYLDVFPKEFLGLPPDREIEFSIDLIPRAEPVSKAPYRMAPVEMKELAKQLQELLNK
ncbi:uncharacterized protein LOC141715025 [Apium graveolens]|uniref:uncharacterized protein LOC141715025 n=1 Tax=Apium graveolens TaxID=4045 RepID=UPI003D79DFA9